MVTTNNIITSAQVIEIAFDTKLREALIPETKIRATLNDHVRPAVTAELFDHLNGIGPFTVMESDARLRIREAAAWLIKYECQPDIFYQTGNTGLNTADTQGNQKGGAAEMRMVRQSALNTGRSLLDIAVSWIKDNSSKVDFQVKYDFGLSTGRTHRTPGGILLSRRRYD